jgi:hypothetical protein
MTVVAPTPSAIVSTTALKAGDRVIQFASAKEGTLERAYEATDPTNHRPTDHGTLI